MCGLGLHLHVYSTLSWSNTQANCEYPGKPAEKAERRKLAKYEYLTSDYIFIPIANETMGTWGKLGLDFIKELGGRISERTGEPQATNYLFQSLSCALQRGNATSVLQALPNGRNLDELFI